MTDSSSIQWSVDEGSSEKQSTAQIWQGCTFIFLHLQSPSSSIPLCCPCWWYTTGHWLGDEWVSRRTEESCLNDVWLRTHWLCFVCGQDQSAPIVGWVASFLTTEIRWITFPGWGKWKMSIRGFELLTRNQSISCWYTSTDWKLTENAAYDSLQNRGRYIGTAVLK